MNAHRHRLADFFHEHRRAIVSVLLIAAVVLIAASDVLHDGVERLLGAMREVIADHPVAGVVLFVGFTALSAMVVFFSAALIVPVAIYAWGRPMTAVLLGIGWLLGGALSYLIGRYPGRRVVRWLVPRDAIRRYEKVITARSSFPLVALFQLAVPSEIPGYVLGTVRYPFWRYLAVLAASEILFAVGAVYLGDSFLRREYGWLIGIGLAGIALSATAMLLFRARVRGLK